MVHETYCLLLLSLLCNFLGDTVKEDWKEHLPPAFVPGKEGPLKVLEVNSSMVTVRFVPEDEERTYRIEEDDDGIRFLGVSNVTKYENAWPQVPMMPVLLKKPRVDTEDVEHIPTKVTDAILDVDIIGGTTLLIRWSLEMVNGEPFNMNFVKSLVIEKYFVIAGGSYKRVATFKRNVADLEAFDNETSPGYSFRITCVKFVVTVTFESDNYLTEQKEKCFSILSPSFLLLFVFSLCVAAILTVVKMAMLRDDDHIADHPRKFRRMEG